MYSDERRDDIVRLARKEGRLLVTALADRYDVTTETIRRDLRWLERRGLVRRVHGGAMPLERPGIKPAVAERESPRRTEKARIGRAALMHLPTTGSVLIDAGTTTGELAAVLPPDLGLTVITHSLPIALQVASTEGYDLWMPGGRVRHRTLAQVDTWALRSLADVRVDVAFVACNGMSVEYGLTTPDFAESEIKRRLIGMADRIVLLADSSKLGRTQLARFGEVADLDVLITDDRLSDDAADALSTAGPKVIRV